MKKRAFAVLFGMAVCLCSSITGKCENIETYSDDYVSFDYMDDVKCDIYYIDISFAEIEEIARYGCYTRMKETDCDIWAEIQIFDINTYEEINGLEKGAWKEHYFSDLSKEEYDQKVISEGEFPELELTYNDGTGNVGYAKLIGNTEKDFLVAFCVVNSADPEASGICRTFYDSAAVTENYLKEGFILDEECSSKDIYEDVLLSEQGEKYAYAAIDILEKYLSFEMEADEASKKIEEIKERCEDYAETSEYIYDDRTSHELYVTSLSIDMGSDSSINETLQDLKKLVHME